VSCTPGRMHRSRRRRSSTTRSVGEPWSTSGGPAVRSRHAAGRSPPILVSLGMKRPTPPALTVAVRHRVRALHHARRAPRLGCAPKPRGAGGSIEHGSALRPGRDTFGAHVAEEVRRAWRGDGGAVVPDSSWRHPHVAPTARRSLETDARGRLAPVSRSRNVQRSIPAHARLPGRSRGSGSGPAETASERASTPSGRPDGTPQRGGSALPRGHRSVRLVGCCRT